MHNVIFQRARGDEREQWIGERLGETDSTAIVFSSTAAKLADRPQPTCRSSHQLVRLRLRPDAPRDSFNPLDVVPFMMHLDIEAALSVLLEPVRLAAIGPAPEEPSGLTGEPVWPALAVELFESLVGYQVRKKSHCSLIEAVNRFYSDDHIYHLAKLLEKDAKLMDPAIYTTLSSFLNQPDLHRATVLSIVHGAIACLNTAPAQRALGQTTFDLNAVASGRATVYVEVPPQLWASHSLVARLWLVAFLQLAAATGSRERPTLIVVDNASDLGMFPQFLAVRQLPAWVTVWSLWDSLGQLKANHPADWSALVGSCEVVQAVGPQGLAVAAELSDAFGVSEVELRQLVPGDQRTLAGGGPDAAAVPKSPAGATGTVSWGHTITFAPAHAARWAGMAERILERESSVIVVEPAGECHALTAAGRAARGPVVRLDPFGVLGEAGDRFNPLDLLGTGVAGVASDSYQIAQELGTSGTQAKDAFWNNCSLGLVRAVIQYIATDPDKPLTLGEVCKALHGDNVVYSLAVVLDTIGKKLPEDCYKEIAMFLQLPDNTQSRVLAEVTRCLGVLGAKSVQLAVAETTFDPAAVAGGRATVYIEIPPSLWRSYGLLARLWLSELLRLSTSAADPAVPTLLIVDHADGLDMFQQLLEAQRLPAGLLEVWSFWETLGQLKVKHPADWTAFIGSCRTVQVLGPQNPVVAAELASVFGASEVDLGLVAPGRRMTLAGGTAAAAAPTVEPATKAVQGGHVVTFAAASARKWDSVAATIQDREPSSVVVVEPAGRLHALTAAGRSAVGQVIRLDPFGVLKAASHSFNPLDLFRVAGASTSADRLGFTELLHPPDPITVNPFWRPATLQLVLALLTYLLETTEEECSLVELRAMVADIDAATTLTKIRDSEAGKKLSDECKNQLGAFLRRPDAERSTILALAYHALHFLGDPLVASVAAKSDFDLRSVMNGEPITIFIELPPFRMPYYRLLVHLWMSSLLIASSDSRTGGRPLFVLDNQFASDLFPLLHRAQGLTFADLWTFWDSLDQLRFANPADWSAFLANARRVDVVGPQGALVATELAQAFGCRQPDLQSLPPGEWKVLYESLG